MLCKKYQHAVLMPAFSQKQCSHCGRLNISSHTPPEDLCPECSEKLGWCQRCGRPMRLLIAIEGADGSGKATQAKLLAEKLIERGAATRQLSFPCYDSESSALVRMYLNGAMGKHPDDVNAYAASTFFAVDRYASYKSDWAEQYQNGDIIVADRYTMSNAIHQGAKMDNGQCYDYLDWLYEFEFERMGIPKPDIVFYLDVDKQTAARLRQKREAETNTAPDIHEADLEYQARCRESAIRIAHYSGWEIVRCVGKDGAMRTAGDISAEIYHRLDEFAHAHNYANWPSAK